jgi:uncharacterized membrane protein YdjX (TVP38/TMEM64 family)
MRIPTGQTAAWRLRTFAGISLLSIVVAGAIMSQFWPQMLGKAGATTLSTIHAAGEVGWVVFLALQTIVVVSGILPASTVGIAAGAAYGLMPGFLLAATSVLAGAFISFGLARSLARPLVTRLLARRGRLRRFDDLAAREGWKIVCLLRISPIMPFAATSYGLGLTSISSGEYLIGTLASLPALFAYVLVGKLTHAGFSAWSGSAPLRLVLVVAAIAATILLTIYVSRLAARSGIAPLAAEARDMTVPMQCNDP